MSSRTVGNTTTVLPICAFRKKPELEINYLFISVSPSENYVFTINFVKTQLPWLIWATHNSFSKISENKTENRSKNTWSRKILRGREFYILFCIVFSDISGNGKYVAARDFTRPRYLLDKVKVNCFEVNYRQKTEVITRDKLYLTWPHIYILFSSSISGQSKVEKHIVELYRDIIYMFLSQIR